MKTYFGKSEMREARRKRVRARVSGSANRPRLCVFRSLSGMEAQLINDETGRTIASSRSKGLLKEDAGDRKGKVAIAYIVGKTLAKKAKELGIVHVVFDRAGYRYHGRVAAVADGARDGGLVL